MNKEQLHSFISESTGNESNICQIHVIRGGKSVYRTIKMEDGFVFYQKISEPKWNCDELS